MSGSTPERLGKPLIVYLIIHVRLQDRALIALKLSPFHFRFPRPMRPFVHRDVMVEMWEESDSIQHYLMTEDGE